MIYACGGPLYLLKSLKGHRLIEEFQQHPCCGKKCAATLCSLPFTRAACCVSCVVPGKAFDVPTDAGLDDQQKLIFLQCVSASREAWKNFMERDGDAPTLRVEKQRKLNNELLRHFTHYGRSSGQSWTWDDAFVVRLHSGQQ